MVAQILETELLIFHRKDLCEAKHEMTSEFKFGSSNPPVVASSGQEWQYDICTVTAHIGRPRGRSIPLVVTSSGQEW